jgi:hypothetical protein
MDLSDMGGVEYAVPFYTEAENQLNFITAFYEPAINNIAPANEFAMFDLLAEFFDAVFKKIADLGAYWPDAASSLNYIAVPSSDFPGEIIKFSTDYPKHMRGRYKNITVLRPHSQQDVGMLFARSIWTR